MFFQLKENCKQGQIRSLHLMRSFAFKKRRRIDNGTVGGMRSFEALENRTLLAADVTFADSVRYSAGLTEPGHVTIGDVNGDGAMDLIASNFGNPGRLSVLLGNGDGTFNRGQRVGAFFSRNSVLGDFDSDGDLDIAASSLRQGSFHVLLNLGSTEDEWNGVSESTVGSAGFIAGSWATTGDFDGDGDLDALVTWSDVSLWVLLNNGSSNGQWNGFAEPVKYSHNGWRATVGDLNQDGNLDIIQDPGVGRVLLGNGDGTFGEPVSYGGGGSILGDLDGDGILDTAGASHGSKRVSVLLGNGDGTFEEFQSLSIRGGGVGDMTSGDFDGDGDLDLATVDFVSDEVWLLINNGDGTFVEREEPFSFESRRSPSLTSSLTAGDVDGDGDIDLAVAACCDAGRGIHIFLNTTPVDIGPQPGDVNHDGIFNSGDLVLVFAAGEYEDEIAGNSTFEEGDWDGDGDFTTADLVLAFRSGGYEATAVFPPSQVDETSLHDWTMDLDRRKQAPLDTDTTDEVFLTL